VTIRTRLLLGQAEIPASNRFCRWSFRLEGEFFSVYLGSLIAQTSCIERWTSVCSHPYSMQVVDVTRVSIMTRDAPRLKPGETGRRGASGRKGAAWPTDRGGPTLFVALPLAL
jgi:hypothetical protein